MWISSKLQSGTAHKPCETRVVELGLWEQITDVPALDHGELRPADRLTPATTSSEGERYHLKGNDVMPDFPLYWFWKASKLAIPYHSGWGKNSRVPEISLWDFFENESKIHVLLMLWGPFHLLCCKNSLAHLLCTDSLKTWSFSLPHLYPRRNSQAMLISVFGLSSFL